jgi:hypothetical protein
MIKIKLVGLICSLYLLTGCVVTQETQKEEPSSVAPIDEKQSSEALKTQGILKGASLVSETWEKLNHQCDQVSKLFSTIDKKVHQEANTGTMDSVSIKGYIDGLEIELMKISNQCGKTYSERWKEYFQENKGEESEEENQSTGNEPKSESQLTRKKPNREQQADPRFQKGYQLGSSLVTGSWNSFSQQCNKKPTLSKIVDKALNKLHQEAQRGKYEELFVMGYEDGLNTEMARIESECE